MNNIWSIFNLEIDKFRDIGDTKLSLFDKRNLFGDFGERKVEEYNI